MRRCEMLAILNNKDKNGWGKKVDLDKVISAVATPMFVVDENLIVRNVSDVALKTLGYSRGEVVGKMTCAELCKTPLCGTANCMVRRCMRTGETIIEETEAQTRDGRRVPIEACCSAIFDDKGKPIGGMEVILDRTDQEIAMEEINRLSAAAEAGQLNERADPEKASTEGFKRLFQGINDMLDAILEPIGEAVTVIDKLAAFDLTARMEGEYKGDHARLKNSLNAAMENLQEFVRQVAAAAEQVAAAAEQVSSGSQALSQSTTEQASAVEEVSSSLQELVSMATQNADSAKEGKSITDSARANIADGVESMRELSQAIERIKSSADETSKIIKTIDEIAFQT
ncbi:TPA: PAS domain-containing protein, partial [Candidatus Poribacteria bacterium]|nr:PAS domain-containing protein [Candidatus Poribacteria bacterium]HEX28736.1 PAS domain-containing protein [Candidatus Poribacteria bacterium]